MLSPPLSPSLSSTHGASYPLCSAPNFPQISRRSRPRLCFSFPRTLSGSCSCSSNGRVDELRVCASGSTGGYLLCVQRGASGPHAFHVVLRPDATAKDILHAYLFAFEFRQEILELLKQAKTEQWNEEILMAKIAGVRTTLARRAQSTFDDFVNAAELSGWRLHFLQMTVGPSRATWASVQDVHEQEAGSPSFKIKRWSSEQSLSGASQTSLV
eukprot:m.691176 g.691176  ORF g.691176 m.691176 type:complete len:213 (-) comp58639_c1_seq3:669-1307(-)